MTEPLDIPALHEIAAAATPQEYPYVPASEAAEKAFRIRFDPVLVERLLTELTEARKAASDLQTVLTSGFEDIAKVKAELVAARSALSEAQTENERLRESNDALWRESVKASARIAKMEAERDAALADVERLEASGDRARRGMNAAKDEVARIRSAIEALADKWETDAGPDSEARRVYGPQNVSVPFVVQKLRAIVEAIPVTGKETEE
jgi:chromosome segregation ATPase